MGQAKPASLNNVEAYAPTAETIRVMCDCDSPHPVAGLFVVWRPMCCDKEVGPTASGNAPSARGNALSLEQRILGVARAQNVNLPVATTEGEYNLAVTDHEGFLQPVIGGHYPLYDQPKGRIPHSLKLLRGQPYEGCLVRHPDPSLASDLRRYLSGDASPELQTTFAQWTGGTGSLVSRLDIQDKPGQLILRAPANSTEYVPKGARLYDNWYLYQDMPHGGCEPVRKQQWRLAFHLGALRYPVGKATNPYVPGDDEGEVTFNALVCATVTQFQSHHSAGKHFVVAEAARPHAHGSLVQLSAATPTNGTAYAPLERAVGDGGWAYLLGSEPDGLARPAAVDAANPNPPYAARTEGMSSGRRGTPSGTEYNESAWTYPNNGPSEFPQAQHEYTGYRERIYPGLVDMHTGDNIATWLRRGYRKPGKVLLPISAGLKRSGQQMWMREDAAIQIEDWRALSRAFGCRVPIGTDPGLALREIGGVPGQGQIFDSLHKTGLAVDLFLLTDSKWDKPRNETPVAIEGRWIPDKSAGPQGPYRTRWVLYACSSLDVFRESLSALKSLMTNVDEYPGDLVKTIRERVPEPLRASPEWNAIERHVGDCAKRSKVCLAAMINERGGEMVKDCFFRKDIRPFSFDRASFRGGKASRNAVSAPARDSFVNLTALALLCGISSIFAQTRKTGEGWKANMRGPLNPSGQLQEILQLVSASRDLFDRSDAQSRKEENWIVIRCREGETQLRPHDVDCKFLEDWINALAQWRAFAKSDPPLLISEPAVSIPLDGWRKLRVSGAMGQFTERFAEKEFFVSLVGRFAGMGLVEPFTGGESVKGADVPRRLDAAWEGLSFWRSISRKSELEQYEDTIVELVPFLDTEPGKCRVLITPSDGVLVRVGASGANREWWHFQGGRAQDIRGIADQARAATWGQLMESIGCSGEILLAAAHFPAGGVSKGYYVRGFGVAPKTLNRASLPLAPAPPTDEDLRTLNLQNRDSPEL